MRFSVRVASAGRKSEEEIMIPTAQAFGIDIGGSGIKGAPVDLNAGQFATDRLRIPTPEVSTPDAVADVVTEILNHFDVQDGTPIGVAFPAPIKPGKPIDFMANLDQSWVGVDITKLLSEKTGRRIYVVNDADAAGLAEVQYGAAKGQSGLVIATTLGTGIGTALIIDGVLVPNTELGHLELEGKDAEHYASDAARSRKDLNWKKWGKRLTKYYSLLEKYFNPDLFVVGGGVSKKSAKFFPYIKIDTPIVPAQLLNDAGIIGAAYFADHQQHLEAAARANGVPAVQQVEHVPSTRA
jgi:polyphosphate glucokinase